MKKVGQRIEERNLSSRNSKSRIFTFVPEPRTMKIIPILFFALALTACAQQTPNDVPGLADNVKSYGAVIEADNVMTSDQLMESLSKVDSVECTFSGTIQETCSKKGCWMTLDAGMADEMRVRFADYGFFVPTEGQAGKRTVMKGKAYKSITPVDELQHYAEDAGKSPEEIAKITEPEVAISFLADGVLIYEEKE